MKRSTAIAGLWFLLFVELVYVGGLTGRVHNTEDFLFGVVLLFVTLAIGAITVFALPADR